MTGLFEPPQAPLGDILIDSNLLPLLRSIHQRLKRVIDKLALRRSILPQSKLGKAISYAIHQWPNLETYLADGRIDICNNLVENAITLTPANWLKARNGKPERMVA